MKGYQVFEELRFIIEVLIAEHILFLWAPIQKKKGFKWKFPLSIAIFIGMSFLYFPIANGVNYLNLNFPIISTDSLSWQWNKFFGYWYMFLFALTVISLKLLYKASWATVLSRSLLGWCIQHFEYCFCNEMIGIGFWNNKREQLLLPYILLSIFTCFAYYFIFYKLLKKYIKFPKIDDFKSKYAVFAYIILLIVLISFTFFCQSVFYWTMDGRFNYKAVMYDGLICIVFIIMQTLVMRINKANIEKKEAEMLFAEREKQFLQNKQSIDIINHKVHDLKHQMSALMTMSKEEQSKAFHDVYEGIRIYDSTFHTGNEVIDTILTEKKLLCEKYGITLTAIINGKLLSFMDKMDILVLFGNLLDNAIEAVEKLTDKKTISITLSEVQGMVSIQSNNYYEGSIQMVDKTIMTSKKDKEYHGYGLKSIKEIVNRYNGRMLIKTDNQIFIVQIILPKH